MGKDEYRRRLRRIEGQIRGLQRMVADDTACVDVLTQFSSVTNALASVAVALLDDHLRHSATHPGRHHRDPDAYLELVSRALAALAGTTPPVRQS